MARVYCLVCIQHEVSIVDHWFLSVRTGFLFYLPPTPPSLPPSLSMALSLALSLYEGERGRLHRAWQQCSVECELEMWNKDAQQPWKQCAVLITVRVCCPRTRLHFVDLSLKRSGVRF